MKTYLSYETMVSLFDAEGIGTVAIVLDIGNGKHVQVAIKQPVPHDIATVQRVLHRLVMSGVVGFTRIDIDLRHPGVTWAGAFDPPTSLPPEAIVVTRYAEEDETLNGCCA